MAVLEPGSAAWQGEDQRALRSESAKGIGAAAASAGVGLELPPMSQLRGWRRRLATPAARLVLRLAQIVTHGQRAYNEAVVRALAALAERLERVEHRLLGIERQLATQGSLLELRLEALEDATAASVQQQAAAAAQSRERTSELERRLGARLAAVERPLAPPLEDALYWQFENRFRGSREEIRRRAEVYLEPLRACGAGHPARPVLELGCGRGELLELLIGAGRTARGVDQSAIAVDQCRALGLPVCRGDALEHLRAMADRSCGAIVALHLLEHLPVRSRVDLVREAARALQPGGLLIVECPNPQTLLVGASSYYLDPSHGRPLHPQFLRFLYDAHGFEQVRVLELHPVEVPPGGKYASRLEELVFGAQDFALIGSRPWGG